MTLLITLISCNKTDEPIQNGFNLDVGLEFSIINSLNEDLLDPNNPNHIDESKIKLFYVVNGETQEVYDGNMDNPRNFMIYKHENEYRIGIFQNTADTEEKPITYIRWNDNDTDTIETSYERTTGAVIQRKIWLNGEQIWDWTENQDPFFILTK